MVHKMKTFCCGCTLQTGTIVVAVLAAVSAVCDVASLGGQQYLVAISNFWLVLVVNVILDVARLVTSILMIRGASSGTARLVRPWYVVHVVLLSVFFVHCLVSFFFEMSNDNMSDSFIGLGWRIALISIYAFGVYTVHCYYQQLLESQGNLDKVLEATQPPQIFVTSEKDIKLVASGCSSSQLSSGDNTVQETTYDHGGDVEAVLLWLQPQDRFSHHSCDVCDFIWLAPIDELHIHVQHVLRPRTLSRFRTRRNEARNSCKDALAQSDAGRGRDHDSLGNSAACAGSASHLRDQQGRPEVGATLGCVLHARVHCRRSGDAGLFRCSLHPSRIRRWPLHPHHHDCLGKYERILHPGGVQLLQRTPQQLRSKKNLVGASEVNSPILILYENIK